MMKNNGAYTFSVQHLLFFFQVYSSQHNCTGCVCAHCKQHHIQTIWNSFLCNCKMMQTNLNIVLAVYQFKHVCVQFLDRNDVSLQINQRWCESHMDPDENAADCFFAFSVFLFSIFPFRFSVLSPYPELWSSVSVPFLSLTSQVSLTVH